MEKHFDSNSGEIAKPRLRNEVIQRSRFHSVVLTTEFPPASSRNSGDNFGLCGGLGLKKIPSDRQDDEDKRETNVVTRFARDHGPLLDGRCNKQESVAKSVNLS